MARNAWETEIDELGMQQPKGPRRWGRVVTGLVIVASATFALAFYVPLSQAHTELTKLHAESMTRAASLSENLGKSDRELEAARERLDELEAAKKERDQANEQAAEKVGAVQSSIASGVSKHVQSKLITLTKGDDHVRAVIKDKYLYTPGRDQVSRTGRLLLCDLAKASGSHALRIDTVIAKTSRRGESAWEDRAAKASSVADTLTSQCSLPDKRVVLRVHAGQTAGSAPAPGTTEIQILAGD